MTRIRQLLLQHTLQIPSHPFRSHQASQLLEGSYHNVDLTTLRLALDLIPEVTVVRRARHVHRLHPVLRRGLEVPHVGRDHRALVSRELEVVQSAFIDLRVPGRA